MDLLTKSREELLELAEKLKLDVPKHTPESRLREMVETEAIRKTVEMEERARLRLQEQSKMKIDIAEIQAEAGIRGITIDIPKEPTITDIVRLKKELNLMINEPKPSPETLAIEKSKKVYARFVNREQEDMDVTFNVGGKYFFHFWPDKVHIIPEWLIGYCRGIARFPVYGKVKSAGGDEATQRTGWKQRWFFETLADAPDDASFGIVLDEKILSKFKQPV